MDECGGPDAKCCVAAVTAFLLFMSYDCVQGSLTGLPSNRETPHSDMMLIAGLGDRPVIPTCPHRGV